MTWFIRAFRHRHLVVYSLLAALFWAAVAAVCFYMLIDVVQYMAHTSPCHRMGTCPVRR
jgi:hypothetical protein